MTTRQQQRQQKLVRANMREAALLWRKTGIPFHLRSAKAYKAVIREMEFRTIIATAQEIQKRNPFGSLEHRVAYETIRAAVKAHKGIDIGIYE